MGPTDSCHKEEDYYPWQHPDPCGRQSRSPAEKVQNKTMKSALFVVILYLLLPLLMVSCTEEKDAVPSCMQVEVIGADCDTGWYLLQILDQEKVGEQRSQQYIGQLQSGIVTTDNLPAALQQPGLLLDLSLELYGEKGPRCVSIFMMYPPVRVKQVCSDNTQISR